MAVVSLKLQRTCLGACNPKWQQAKQYRGATEETSLVHTAPGSKIKIKPERKKVARTVLALWVVPLPEQWAKGRACWSWLEQKHIKHMSGTERPRRHRRAPTALAPLLLDAKGEKYSAKKKKKKTISTQLATSWPPTKTAAPTDTSQPAQVPTRPALHST